ncbi:YceG family protein [Aeromicrobium marinum DSM 15272]|uniref:Endolytic murein transglycosylase n=1 Tax=Aeromicrobium marinum DSM 15272 TaxID=585531 RepID=E2S9F6_9ACTN|nr:endolytic transglycosylase MltG [Aeromicrobium marinum]EFQ83880.1 YceG family protein [Aeromicrobium marinum DSM 15272]
MSNDGLDLVTSGQPPRRTAGHRRAETPRKGPRWGRIVLVLVLLAALVGGGTWAYGKVQDAFSGPEDFTGQGTGEVVVDIPSGSSGQDIATLLFDAGVVASAEAFYQLVLEDSRGAAIEAGTYTLRSQMSAEAALTALVDRANRIEGRVVVTEGARVPQVIETIAANTDITMEALQAAVDNPEALGLPASAEGDPEGYLFPATYTVQPGSTAEQVLAQMVAKSVEVAQTVDLAGRAAAVGLTEREVVTIASILEWEVSGTDDFGRASRVIYNRLEVGEALRMDSTVHFISGRTGDIFTTPEERQSDSPYNTYRFAGLPPGPIGSPGQAALEAALDPTAGDWMYFVADPETGETTFTNTYAEHQQACLAAGFSC